jgi:hypothetical protein
MINANRGQQLMGTDYRMPNAVITSYQHGYYGRWEWPINQKRVNNKEMDRMMNE